MHDYNKVIESNIENMYSVTILLYIAKTPHPKVNVNSVHRIHNEREVKCRINCKLNLLKFEAP